MFKLVLKKAQSAESKDVYIGHQCSEEHWKKLINKSIEEKKWVIQQLVECTGETFIEISNEGPIESNCDYVLSPYLSEGQFSGYLKRYIGKKDTSQNLPVFKNLKAELATSFILPYNKYQEYKNFELYDCQHFSRRLATRYHYTLFQ